MSGDDPSEILASVEERLAALEARIVTTDETLQTSEGGQSPVGSQLAEVHNKLKKLAEENEHTNELWAKYKEIHHVLNSQQIEELGLTPDSKLDIILAGEGGLKAQAAAFEKVKGLQEYVNTSTLQDLPKHTDKLKPLEGGIVALQEGASENERRTLELLKSYNDVIAMLSRKFVHWDKVLSAAEKQVSDLMHEMV